MQLDVIYNEDCLEGMKKLPVESVDLVVTDPPYSLNILGRHYIAYEIDSDYCEIARQRIAILDTSQQLELFTLVADS